MQIINHSNTEPLFITAPFVTDARKSVKSEQNVEASCNVSIPPPTLAILVCTTKQVVSFETVNSRSLQSSFFLVTRTCLGIVKGVPTPETINCNDAQKRCTWTWITTWKYFQGTP
jgi:hypothetical protein